MYTLETRVLMVVSQTLGVDAAALGVESSPDTLPAWDSVSHINLVLALESEFDVRLTDRDVTDMLSIGLILRVLKEHGVPSS